MASGPWHLGPPATGARAAPVGGRRKGPTPAQLLGGRRSTGPALRAVTEVRPSPASADLAEDPPPSTRDGGRDEPAQAAAEAESARPA